MTRESIDREHPTRDQPGGDTEGMGMWHAPWSGALWFGIAAIGFAVWCGVAGVIVGGIVVYQRILQARRGTEWQDRLDAAAIGTAMVCAWGALIALFSWRDNRWWIGEVGCLLSLLLGSFLVINARGQGRRLLLLAYVVMMIGVPVSALWALWLF